MAGGATDAPADRVAMAAGELYGLPLGEFTAARAEQARLARANGDRAAAAAIGKLPKPNVVAWLANQLARQHAAELRPLLELGAALRQATADLDAGQLRQLSRRQHQAVSAVTGLARELAAAAGQGISDSTARGLEETLHAALADEHAARQLTQGRLAAGLSRTGFPGIDAGPEDADAPGSWAIPSRKRSPAGGRDQKTTAAGEAAATACPETRGNAAPAAQLPSNAAVDRTARAAEADAQARRQQLERTRRAEAGARDDVARSGRDQDRARSVLAAAGSVAQQAEETVSRLQDDLDAALDARDNAGRLQRQARKEAERAERVARQAARRLADVTARREGLERDAKLPGRPGAREVPETGRIVGRRSARPRKRPDRPQDGPGQQPRLS
jgi:hypothetical protein